MGCRELLPLRSDFCRGVMPRAERGGERSVGEEGEGEDVTHANRLT